MKKFFSRFARNKITKLRTKLSTAKKKFQENLAEAKSQPCSKRKSLFIGFSTVLSIFGLTLFLPIVPAIAKDLPKNGGGGTVCPEPASAPAPSDKMLEGMAGIAAAVCGAAVTTGPFVVGALCGLVVVIGILKALGK